MPQFTNTGQLAELLLAAGFGMLLGMYYDLFRVLRVVVRPKRTAVFLQDLVFWATSAVTVFLFTIPLNGGRMRGYILAGLVTGFAVYHMTVGRLVLAAAVRLTYAVIWLWSGFWRLIFFPFRKGWRWVSPYLAHFLRGIRAGGWSFMKKNYIFCKKLLPKGHRSSYNITSSGLPHPTMPAADEVPREKSEPKKK